MRHSLHCPGQVPGQRAAGWSCPGRSLGACLPGPVDSQHGSLTQRLGGGMSWDRWDPRGGKTGLGEAGVPEELYPLPELLLTPAQGAGTLQTRVVSEPGALVAVPVLPAEQVKDSLLGRRTALSGPRVPRQLVSSLDLGVSHLSSGDWREAKAWPALSLSPSPSTLGPQVPRVLPENHRSQDVRSHRPGFHLPQLHHHSPREAGHRPGKHREAPFFWEGRGLLGAATLSPPCSCRSASSSVSPTMSSRRSSWLRCW